MAIAKQSIGILTIGLISIPLFISSSQACRPDAASPEKILEEMIEIITPNKIILEGKVVEHEQIKTNSKHTFSSNYGRREVHYNKYTIEVDKWWRGGDSETIETITVINRIDLGIDYYSSKCRRKPTPPEFKVGEKWLLMGNYETYNPNDLVIGTGTNLDSLNVRLDNLSTDEFEYLKSLQDEFEKEYQPSAYTPGLPPKLDNDFFENPPKNRDIPIPIIKIKNFLHLIFSRF